MREGNPLEQALRWERVVHSSSGQAAADSALYEKALCYLEADLPGEALKTLDRIRVYMLEPSDIQKVMFLKYRCSLECGDLGAALGYLEESGADMTEVNKIVGKGPKDRKEGAAAALSFLPPFGQIYVGRPLEGVGALVANAAAVCFTVAELSGHYWITGLLGGGLLLNETFFKWNLDRNMAGVEAANKAAEARKVELLRQNQF